LRSLAAAPWLPRSGDKAPARLIYVADVDRLEQPRTISPAPDAETLKAYCHVDCGIVAANVYLFAAAAGLNAWFHECDRQALAKRLPLRAGRRVLFAQTVGYPY
jgi:nitroreductase